MIHLNFIFPSVTGSFTIDGSMIIIIGILIIGGVLYKNRANINFNDSKLQVNKHISDENSKRISQTEVIENFEENDDVLEEGTEEIETQNSLKVKN